MASKEDQTPSTTTTPPVKSTEPPCPPFFLNIRLLNKEDLVAKTVQEKAGTGFVGRVAAYAANKMVTDDKIITNLSDTLMDTIKKSVQDMGIQMDVQKRFQQGSFVVIQFQVLDIELLKVLKVAKGEDFAQHFEAFLEAAKGLGLGDTIVGKVYEKIYGSLNEGMLNKLSTLVPTKMKEKGVEVEIEACTADREGLVFFDILHGIAAI